MVMLRGFLVLVVFFLLGEAVRVFAGMPVSGGVLGMVMATVTLMVRGRVSTELATASQGLISILVLLITPGVVGVFFIADQFSGHWATVLVALVIGTLLSVFTTLLLMKKMAALGKEGGSHDRSA
ncbi:MAG: putative effector of murein hydrolase LrgA [Marinobacter excellens HL-55]|uniref:Putative effector of murein hydrolase LrgA n=1 Tax=Marinobacter excellens HL-55 TaxID=1305731 RepID=A0A0P8B190_9GAMM|nr:MAG: putative effector of murein hydrolase LrgA [Marinobacter excellens HL-55]